jgi:multiple sugar transport system substrate-binding protein
MKKICLFFLMFFLVFQAFAGGSPESAKTDEQITLTIWTHEDPNRQEIEDRYIEEFEAANPDIKIEKSVNSSDMMDELLLTAFAANEGPDIFNLQIEDAYMYIINGRVAPVDTAACGYSGNEDLVNAYIPGVLDAVTEKGEIYGLPLELTNWCIYVNKQVFRDAGLDAEKDYPETWEEMVDISEKLTLRDGEIVTRRGFDFRYPYYLVSMIPMVEQLGGAVVSDDGKTAIVNDEAWLEFLKFMQEWGPNGNNLGSPTYKNARKLFNLNNNDIGMCQSGLYQAGRIREQNEEFYNSGDWMVIPYPQFENAVNNVACCYYGHFYMVNAQSSEAEQEAAWKFISFMLSHPEEYLEKVGLIQPTKELMASDTYRNMEYSNIFAADMEKSHIVYYAENSARMQELIREAVESVMLGGVDPEKSLASLKVKAQELLDQ